MRKYFGYYMLLIFMVFIWACSDDSTIIEIDDDNNTPVAVTFSRAELLENWADNIIIPSYEAFIVSFTAFEASFENFRSEPTTESFNALRTAWEAAYISWQHISMFEIGPAETDGLRLNINTFPADVTLIESQIESGIYNFDLSSTRDTKGFPALDYLFNGREDNLAVFTDPITSDSNMIYTNDVIADMGTRARTVLAAWQSDFRDEFIASDGSSSVASVDRLTNDYIFYYERFLRAGKMGIPAGVFSGNVAPNTIEALYQDGLSNILFLEALDAVQDFFNGIQFNGGINGLGYDDYLETIDLGGELVNQINNQLNVARTEVSALDSFSSEIANNDPPIDMLMAYDEVQRVVVLIKTDLLSLLSIDVDFVDADGD